MVHQQQASNDGSLFNDHGGSSLVSLKNKLEKLVGHLVHLHLNVIPTLCEFSEMLTEWQSKSITNLPTDGLTRVGDA